MVDWYSPRSIISLGDTGALLLLCAVVNRETEVNDRETEVNDRETQPIFGADSPLFLCSTLNCGLRVFASTKQDKNIKYLDDVAVNRGTHDVICIFMKLDRGTGYKCRQSKHG